MKLEFSRKFSKKYSYQISRKSVQWEPSCYLRTEGQMDIAFRNVSNERKITARHDSWPLRQETPRCFYFLPFYPTLMSVYRLTSCYVPEDFNIYQRRCRELQIYDTFKSKNIELSYGTPRKSSSVISYVSGFPLACKTLVAPNISVRIHSSHLSDNSPRILHKADKINKFI